MPKEIKIYFNGKVVGKMFNERIGDYMTHRMECYEGFSEYKKYKQIESFGKINYSEWNY